MMRSLVLGLAIGAVAAPAFAHAMLERAIPAVGSIGNAAPADIRLKFSEQVEPALSKVDLESGDGRPLGVGSLSVLPSDHHVLVVKPAKPFGPGIYHVIWKVVSVDTHRTQGDYCFTVGR